MKYQKEPIQNYSSTKEAHETSSHRLKKMTSSWQGHIKRRSMFSLSPILACKAPRNNVNIVFDWQALNLSRIDGDDHDLESTSTWLASLLSKNIYLVISTPSSISRQAYSKIK